MKMSSEISSVVNIADSIEGVFIGLGLLILLYYVSKGLYHIYSDQFATHSQRYRKHLTNLYVAGRIRQFAEQDKVDLDKENLACLKFVDMDTCKKKELDDRIEQQLIKNIEEEKLKKEKKE